MNEYIILWFHPALAKHANIKTLPAVYIQLMEDYSSP